MTAATLALDMGRNSGWAIRWHGGRVESGVFPLLKRRDRGEGYRYHLFRKFLTDTKQRIELGGAQLVDVLYENPGGLRWPSAQAAELAFGLKAVLLVWCEHHGIPYRGLANSTVKKFVAGHGHAEKPAVHAIVSKHFGVPIVDHNQGDALALLFCEGP